MHKGILILLSPFNLFNFHLSRFLTRIHNQKVENVSISNRRVTSIHTWSMTIIFVFPLFTVWESRVYSGHGISVLSQSESLSSVKYLRESLSYTSSLGSRRTQHWTECSLSLSAVRTREKHSEKDFAIHPNIQSNIQFSGFKRDKGRKTTRESSFSKCPFISSSFLWFCRI